MSALKNRLARLEATIDPEAGLDELYLIDTDLLEGSEEWLAAVADPIGSHLAERRVFKSRADEPGPEHPIW